MLVLHSTSRCDVCLLEYNWETSARVPHAIACGHIFCRDCLYATIPPLCPLCRKQYQPAKIKKLHVDRPENVDEAREAELGKQQLELLGKLVDIWDLELQEGFMSNVDLIDEDNRGHGAVTNHESPTDADSIIQRRARIAADLGLVSNNTDEAYENELPLEGNALQLDRGGVEQILDGIAGTAGIGRGFLERWGSDLGNDGHGPIVTMRAARRAQYGDVMRQVDLWLESKDEEGIVLQKYRRFFTEYISVRIGLKDALTANTTVNENHSKLLLDLQRLDENRLKLQAEIDEIRRFAEHMAIENQELKARLQRRSSPERQTRSQSAALRNPLPAPPEPVALEHLPTFAQAISEGSLSAPGSGYGSSIHSSAGSNQGHALGVRFVTPPPSSPKARERVEEFANPDGPSRRSGRKKGKKREASHSYSYRDDSGYFDGENRREPSSSSTMYPNSAPAVVNSHSSSSSRSQNPGTNPLSNSQPVYNTTHDSGQSQSNGIQSREQVFATRSTKFEVDLRASQPIDAFTLTSTYLKEYSAGFINGQEAALGVGTFAHVPSSSSSTHAASVRSGVRKGDSRESILYTTESAEDDARGRTRENSTHTRSSSRSRPRSLTSSISNPQLAAILSPSHPPQPPRRHMATVSLPSTSSHGRSSPSMSLFSANYSHHSSGSFAGSFGRGIVSPTSISSSALVPPPLLPGDPDAAMAMLAGRHPGRISPSVHSQQSWGTDPSNAHSNSLISGLRGLPSAQGDNSSVRTRETRLSIDFAESVRESRRDSRVSDFSSQGPRSVRSGEGARESSPVRPVGTMVGVLPLDEQEPESSQGIDLTYPTNRSITNTNPYRSSTAVDRRMASDSIARGHSSNHSSFQIESRSRRQVSQQTRPTDAQQIAAGWTSTQNINPHDEASYEPEYERNRTSSSRVQNHRDDRASHDERRSRRTTHRSQTAIGNSSAAEPAANSGSSWLWDSDSNVYPSPFSHSSQASSRNDGRHSPPSQPPVPQAAPSTNSNPPPTSYRVHRERDRDVERSSRSRNHAQEHNSNTRPSLLSRDASASFPISVETTDDERYPGTHVNTSSVRSRTAIHANSGRTTRTGNGSSGNLASSQVETAHPPPLQSFGNALGLELNTTANGISAPRPVSSSDTQSFLRSWSQEH